MRWKFQRPLGYKDFESNMKFFISFLFPAGVNSIRANTERVTLIHQRKRKRRGCFFLEERKTSPWEREWSSSYVIFTAACWSAITSLQCLIESCQSGSLISEGRSLCFGWRATVFSRQEEEPRFKLLRLPTLVLFATLHYWSKSISVEPMIQISPRIE